MKYTEIHLTIENDEQIGRLDLALSLLPEIKSRALATKLINESLVRIDNLEAKVKSNTKVKLGMQIHIKIPNESDTGELKPYNYKLDIMHEDDHIIVVNKPSGLVVHPAAGHREDTLVNALIHHCKDFNIGVGEERPGIVHRLDKDTSGVMVVCKTNHALEFLGSQFEQRTVERYYWAMVVNGPQMESGSIESNMGRHPIDRKKMTGRARDGKFAKTDYQILERYHAKLSLMRFKLHTGRTHQIRVHCSENHFPILGDTTYSSPSRLKSVLSPGQIAEISALGRFCLHAAVLGFIHPETKEHIRFCAPIPEDLLAVCERYGFTDKINSEFK